MSTPIVFALHKPKGITCDLSVNAPPNPKRPKDIKTWFDSLAPNLRHIGRLDKQTTGLLLATNTDGGALTARIITPGNISKTYVATVKLTNINQPTPEQLKSLLTNIELPDGLAHFDDIIIVKRHSITYQEIHVTHFVDLQVKISIGKNRIVRRLLAKAGLPVRELKRIAIGGLNIKDLNLPNRSDSVRLTQDEIDRIFVGSKDSGSSGNNGGSGGADSSKVDDLHAEIEISSQSKKRKNSSSSSVSSSSVSSSSGSDDGCFLQVKQPAKKKAKQGKKAKAAKKTHFEGWFSTSQLESFVSRHGLLTDWPLRMVHPQSNKLKKYCLLANQHGHWYMVLVNKTMSPGYYAMLNSLTGDSTNPMIKNNLPGLENRSPRSVPKQQNGSDCGAYFARFAEIVSGVKPSTPGWSDIPRRMARNDVTADDVRRIRADVGAN